MVDTPDYDEQDVAEVFDEDNTNPDEARSGGEDAEQFEDLVDVFDVTSKIGDADDDEAEIGEDLDDEDIVGEAENDDDADAEDDDLRGRLGDADRLEDPDDDNERGADEANRIDGHDDSAASDEVELTYAGDLNDVAGAEGSAADMESEGELDDDDLRELDYKE
jgi:hypothetical protein